jgi:hypothetical protein
MQEGGLAERPPQGPPRPLTGLPSQQAGSGMPASTGTVVPLEEEELVVVDPLELVDPLEVEEPWLPPGPSIPTSMEVVQA